jgi:hypothetical protein
MTSVVIPSSRICTSWITSEVRDLLTKAETLFGERDSNFWVSHSTRLDQELDFRHVSPAFVSSWKLQQFPTLIN